MLNDYVCSKNYEYKGTIMLFHRLFKKVNGAAAKLLHGLCWSRLAKIFHNLDEANV